MTLLLLACAQQPAAPTAPAAPAAASGHSILWISLDTVRADHLALYGGRVTMKNLEEYASGGRVWNRAFSHFPETAPSHWTMFTGVLPEVHGNIPAHGDSRYTGATLAEVAKAAGYATAAFIGGVTLKADSTGLDRGFDRYDDAFAVDPLDGRRPSTQVVGSASQWLSQQTGPYFAFVHFFDAHFPYTPADPRRFDPDYAGKVEGTAASLAGFRDFGRALPARDLQHVVALYDAEVAELDAVLPPLLGRLNGTEIVVITADHGESFEHGYYFNHRGVLSDDVLRVPLVVRGPGVPVGREDGLFGLVDLMPTVLKLAGLSTDAPMMGRERLHGPASSAIWALTDPAEPRHLLGVRTATAKAVWDEAGQGAHYDLAADPDEEKPGSIPGDWSPDPEAYRALVAGMAAHQKELAPRAPPPPGQAEQLQAIGYSGR
jgi:arylsulfatase A-like enzyme